MQSRLSRRNLNDRVAVIFALQGYRKMLVKLKLDDNIFASHIDSNKVCKFNHSKNITG